MVIGISGRLGSGKDTVGKLIQYMTAGDVGAGCLGRIREGLSIDGYHNSTFENKKFAGKLKLVGSILSGVPVENFEDQDFKKLDMSPEWGMTYREFLQKLGTEAMRDGLHTNVWVNALFADYVTEEQTKEELISLSKEIGNEVVNDDWSEISIEEIKSRIPEFFLKKLSNWIITDMRFPNEMDAVKEKGGITIRVNRPKPREMFLMNANTVIDTRVPEHPSETALDNAEFDYVIENSGSFDDLMVKVETILKKEQIPYKRWSI